ncbi:unnamed protein product [Vitrella brassicaformis CCMP3155]|uniref:Uncharacterized protein n=1 Tax=Vitrella brassicaformis (strain CCMP3155) TaxID=1169540 RepID=A0A0G4EHY4_VITBC|nr:unnamed protein product [Vitrella brassicaformis CCMP3155]|eukprot:CEL95556.1 unnamed protein product [Vitrella brassicaformis CCMP3155]
MAERFLQSSCYQEVPPVESPPDRPHEMPTVRCARPSSKDSETARTPCQGRSTDRLADHEVDCRPSASNDTLYEQHDVIASQSHSREPDLSYKDESKRTDLPNLLDVFTLKPQEDPNQVYLYQAPPANGTGAPKEPKRAAFEENNVAGFILVTKWGVGLRGPERVAE